VPEIGWRFFTRCPLCEGRDTAKNGEVEAQALWLDGGTVVDGTGRDPALATGVLIEDGRIARVVKVSTGR
jgi:hypothetical protein